MTLVIPSAEVIDDFIICCSDFILVTVYIHNGATVVTFTVPMFDDNFIGSRIVIRIF